MHNARRPRRLLELPRRHPARQTRGTSRPAAALAVSSACATRAGQGCRRSSRKVRASLYNYPSETRARAVDLLRPLIEEAPKLEVADSSIGRRIPRRPRVFWLEEEAATDCCGGFAKKAGPVIYAKEPTGARCAENKSAGTPPRSWGEGAPLRRLVKVFVCTGSSPKGYIAYNRLRSRCLDFFISARMCDQ